MVQWRPTLIDFTFTNAAGISVVDGAEPGFHADVAEGVKLKQYAEQFPDFKQSSDPSLVILCMEHHDSWSKGTRLYWDERVQAAHQRQAATKEIPLAPPSQLSLDGFSRHHRSLALQREPHPAVSPQGMS